MEIDLILIAISLSYLPVAYQDFKERMVSDVYLVLPYVSFLVTLYIMNYRAIPYIAMAVLLLAAGWILYKKGLLASGDVVALPLIFSSAYAFEYVAIMIMFVFIIHITWFVSKNGMKFNRQVNGNIAKKDSKWLPVKVNGQAISGNIDSLYDKLNDEDNVEETYGVPLAGYIALGNTVGIILFLIMATI